MKKIIISVLFSIFLLIGGIIFGINNFTSTSIERPKYIVIKSESDSLYRYGYPFNPGVKAEEVIRTLLTKQANIKSIKIRNGKKWENIEPTDKIYKSTSIKVWY